MNPISQVFCSKPRKLKLEFYDTDGVRHAISIDGPVSREKIGKVLDLVEVLSGTAQSTAKAMAFSPRKFDRLASLLVSRMRVTEFTSREVQKAFEASFAERIALSTVSTYLSRLVERGLVQKSAQSPVARYRVAPDDSQELRSLPAERVPQDRPS